MSGGDGTSRKRVGDLLDGVRWDYEPKATDRSPLVSARRYFAEFPWDAGELGVEKGAEEGEEQDGAEPRSEGA